MRALAQRARVAARRLAKAAAADKNAALDRMADALLAARGEVLAANAEDVGALRAAGVSGALVDRLSLDPARVAAMAASLREVRALPDPVGEVTESWKRPNGLLVSKVRIPLGVVLVIYEARPNVTAEAASLCVKSGNAVILRGGKEALRSNAAVARALGAGLEAAGLPRDAVQLVPTADRDAMLELLKLDDLIDLCIPRGGEGLIRFVADNARVPVIKHYKGVCHVYVDAAADHEMALAICENAKVSRPGVCNACETILVHAAAAPTIVPALVERLAARGVEIRGCAETRRLGGARVVAASEADWSEEYLALIVSMRVVPSLDAAIAHIERYGSQHTEAIVTKDYATSRRFVDEVASSTVLVNASTRFADGGELGLGAEIGISTTKLHAYGPMGAEELTTTKFVVFGDGQVRT
jgi:glutamate-5-semialdehyde dehydrogenase